MSDPNRDDPAAAGDPASLSGAFGLLADMTDEFADSQDITKTLERALGLISEHLDAEAGSLWLLERDGSELECHASVGPNPITGLCLPSGQGIIGRCVSENRAHAVLDASQDPAFAKSMDEKSGFTTRSLVSAPMSVKSTALGAIQVLNKRTRDGRFSKADVHLLQVLASSAALAISNARMAASLVDAERARRDLELAAEIQRNLLPAPRPAPFPIYGINIPARTVSGDFFDILPLSDGRIAFCLGDVSGKGMNAAMLMAKTASLYRCLSKSGDPPGQVLRMLNDEICETATRGMFVTMAAGILDPETGVAQLANAGHEPALRHVGEGEFSTIPADAPPLGIVADSEFPEVEIDMEGQALYLFSDGLTEAETATGEQLGAEGLTKMLTRLAGTPLAERIEAIIADVQQLELRDDLTLLAVSNENLDR